MHSVIGLLFLAYFLFLFHILGYLSPPIRKKLKSIDAYENNVHYLVIIRQILLFFAPLAIAAVILGNIINSEQLTALLVFGLSINVFWVVQWPLLTKANILVTFETTVIDDNTDFQKLVAFGNERFSEEISFEPEKTTLVRTAIYNLGFSTYKNATVEIYFGDKIRIIPCEDPQYKALDFRKVFTIQKRHGGVVFAPKDNYQSIPPQEVFLFPVFVQTPPISDLNGSVTVQFFSENSWGMNKIAAKFGLPKRNTK